MGKTPAADIPGLTFMKRLGPAAAAAPLGATRNVDRALAPGIDTFHQGIKIKSVKAIAEAAVTGADTNSVTLALRNLGASGAGTTDIASLALTAGVDMAADTPKALTLNATEANLLVAPGDVLTFRQVKVGNGMNIADMHLEVEYELL